MTCPFCGGPMEEGVLQGGRGIFWLDRPSWAPALANGALLGERDWRYGYYVPASHCPKCKKVIASYE